MTVSWQGSWQLKEDDMGKDTVIVKFRFEDKRTDEEKKSGNVDAYAIARLLAALNDSEWNGVEMKSEVFYG